MTTHIYQSTHDRKLRRVRQTTPKPDAAAPANGSQAGTDSDACAKSAASGEGSRLTTAVGQIASAANG